MKPKKSNVLKFFVVALIAVFIFVPTFNFSLLTFNDAHAGVPKILSFQGRLTDASGNLQGSGGTNFYFKFGIFDSLSGGNQLWPSTTIADSATITLKVTQGVFNTLLGDTTAGFEAIGLDFATSNYFLEVRVAATDSAHETLTPRQRIVASGFAINADTVHGGLFINATGVGQFGGLATAAFSRFGTAETSHAGTIIDADDLLVSGGLEVNGSAAFDGFVIFGTNASVSGNLELTAGLLKVLKVTTTPQFRLGRDDSIYSEFYVDGAGDITLSATGGNIRYNQENLWVCSGGGCDATPVSDGNIVIERSFIFDENSFKFKQDTSSTSFQDSLNTQVLIFDESQ